MLVSKLTCPTANGSDEKRVKASWCTAELNKTSRTSDGRYGWKAGSLNIIEVKEIMTGTHMIALMQPNVHAVVSAWNSLFFSFPLPKRSIPAESRFFPAFFSTMLFSMLVVEI
jgi:hypothetical protein